jgi:hypothetical protein
MRPTDTLLGNNRPVLHASLQQNDEMRPIHVLRFSYFTDNMKETDKMDENYGRLWKIRNAFEALNKIISKYYNRPNIWK